MATFEDLLSQIGKAHNLEMDNLRKKHDAEVKSHRLETHNLRAELRKFQQSKEHSNLGIDSGQGEEKHSAVADVATTPQGSGATADLENIEVSVEGSDFSVLAGFQKTLDVDCGFQFERTMQLYSEKSLSNQRRAKVFGGKGVLTRVASTGNWNRFVPKGFVIVPSCTFRLAWDVCGLVLISYDLLTIPFNQAFQPKESTFSTTLDWITLVFWSGDMLQGFFLGYYNKGEVITDNKMILCRYLKTWFIVDAIVVLPEWSMKFMPVGGDNDVGELGKIAKFARVARVLRLLRLLKMKKLLESLVDRIESEYAFILFNLVHLLCFVLVLNHVIACIWYLIGRVTMSSGLQNWVDKGDVKGEEISYLYATSLHWSLTQFTPASMDISARNLWERLFSVMVLLFAMLVFSSIVASITAAMTALRNLQGNEMRQFWLLRRYLRQRNIPKRLSDRIIKFLEHRSTMQGNLVQRDKVLVLGGISEALQDELMHEMHSPELVKHPFFHNLTVTMPAVTHRLCRLALRLQLFAIEDATFNAGDEAKNMWFVKSGDMDYITLTEGMSVSMAPKDWVAEPVLFTQWRHRGSLQACTESELIAVDPKQFMTVMSVHPRPWQYAKSYANALVKYLNAPHEEELTDLLDIEGMYEQLMHECDLGSGSDVVCMVTADKTDRPSPRKLLSDENSISTSAVMPTVQRKSTGGNKNSTTSMNSGSVQKDSDAKKAAAASEADKDVAGSREAAPVCAAEEEARWWLPFGRFWLPCPQKFLSRITR